MITAMPLLKTTNQFSRPPAGAGNPQISAKNSWEAGALLSRFPPVNLPSGGRNPRLAAGGLREDYGSTHSYPPAAFSLNINQLTAPREGGRITFRFLREFPTPFDLSQTGWQS